MADTQRLSPAMAETSATESPMSKNTVADSNDSEKAESNNSKNSTTDNSKDVNRQEKDDKKVINGKPKIEEDSSDIKPDSEQSDEELRNKVLKLESVIEQMKGFIFRTDISALDKVNQVKKLLIPDEEKPKPVINNKRSAAETTDESIPKAMKPNDDGEANSDDEERDIDSCVVCGLYLHVFKEDKAKELHHYMR